MEIRSREPREPKSGRRRRRKVSGTRRLMGDVEVDVGGSCIDRTGGRRCVLGFIHYLLELFDTFFMLELLLYL